MLARLNTKINSRIKRFFTVTTFSLLVTAFAHANSDCLAINNLHTQKAVIKSQQLVSNYLQQYGAIGASIAVSHCGKIVWQQGFGLADIENNVSMTPDTKLRIASISKTLTSVALGQLYQQQKLDLDAPIQQYVPSFPEKRAPITLRQLAGHLAGIRHYHGKEFLSNKAYSSVSDGLSIFKNDPLVNTPGNDYSYSSYGWNLISAAIEQAGQQNFLDYMQTHIFLPAQMTDTLPEYHHTLTPNRGRQYQVSDDRLSINNAPYVDNSYKWAGGGFIGTARDLIKFGTAVSSGKLMARDTFQLLITPQNTRQGESTYYGLGWNTNMVKNQSAGVTKVWGDAFAQTVTSTFTQMPLVGHTGGATGGRSVFMMPPNNHWSIAVIVNANVAPAFALPVLSYFMSTPAR